MLWLSEWGLALLLPEWGLALSSSSPSGGFKEAITVSCTSSSISPRAKYNLSSDQ